MSKLGIEEGIIKVIDGEMYYKSHYCYWLYTQLEELQTRIDKAIQYMEEHPRDFMDEACGGEGVDVVVSILRGKDNE